MSFSLSGCQLLTTVGPEKDARGITDALDNCIVNAGDLGLLRINFFGDGIVNVTDLALLRFTFFSEPDPSGPRGLCD